MVVGFDPVGRCGLHRTPTCRAFDAFETPRHSRALRPGFPVTHPLSLPIGFHGGPGAWQAAAGAVDRAAECEEAADMLGDNTLAMQFDLDTSKKNDRT